MRELFIKNGVDINQPHETPEEGKPVSSETKLKCSKVSAQKAKSFILLTLANGRPLRFNLALEPGIQRRKVGPRSWGTSVADCHKRWSMITSHNDGRQTGNR